MKEQLAKISKRELKIKEILTSLPFETSLVKKELREMGFSRMILDKIWNGTQKDLKALDADIIISYIQQKAKEAKDRTGRDNEYINITIKDLYKTQEPVSVLASKSKFVKS